MIILELSFEIASKERQWVSGVLRVCRDESMFQTPRAVKSITVPTVTSASGAAITGAVPASKENQKAVVVKKQLRRGNKKSRPLSKESA